MKRLQIAWMSWKHISWIQVTGSDFTIQHYENLGSRGRAVAKWPEGWQYDPHSNWVILP